jgi:hypothetical protein
LYIYGEGSMLNYLCIGLLFAILIEFVRDRILRKYPQLYPYKPDGDPYNMLMRFLMVLLWPLCLVVFLIGFYRSYFKK